jgi:hypothetical protein
MSNQFGVGADSPFTKKDMEAILQILEGVTLNGMPAARQMAGLQSRFTAFCVKNIANVEGAIEGPKKGGKKPVDPLA